MRIMDLITTDLQEKWTEKYKRSINCSHPKGFSQKAHCAGRRKRRAGRMEEQTKVTLTRKDPVERWIAVFKASTHPKFTGKSPADRERMARAAHYRVVQNHNPFKAKG